MKNSIKRAQSRAGSSFAERENFRPKVKQQKTKQLIMTLVALLALTTHAWAEQSETIETKADDENVVYDDYTGTHFKITASLGSNDDGIILWNNSTSGTAKIEALNGEIITKIEMQFRNGGQHATLTTTTEGNLVATDSEYADNNISVTDINATSVTIGTTYSTTELAWGQIDKFVIHYANPVPLNWDATAKTASIAAMPAGNVTVNVKYFAQAELAKSTGETPELLAPAAIADVPANTDAPIVTAGTVANIGTSEVKQGTLKYFVKQADGNTAPTAPDYDTDGWSDKVPTADGLAKGNVYVWYYIEGAEPAQGTGRTDANTRSDSDIMPLGSTGFVTLAAEPTYDVTLNAEGLSDEEAAAWKVAKGTDDPAAFPLEGVKKGETVTVTYSGTRKVIGVKAEKKAAGLSISLNNPAVGQLIGNDGKNYNYGAVPTGVTALAMICHISGDHGVALALEDYGFKTWNAVKEALETYEPKFTNATWDMPTEDEWGQMNQTAGGYGTLRDSFQDVGGANMSQSSYWSSTSVDANNAKNFSFFNGSWSSYDKNDNRYTRLRLAW